MKQFRLNTLAVAMAALALAACSSNSGSTTGLSADTADKRNNLVATTQNTVVSPNNSGSQTTRPTANNNSASQTTRPTANNNSGSQTTRPTANNNSGSQTTRPVVNNNSGSQAANPPANNNSGNQAANPPANNNSGSQAANPPANNNSGSQNDNAANNNSGSQNDNAANNNSGSQNDNAANNNSGSQNDNSANNNSGSQNDNSGNNSNDQASNNNTSDTPPADHSAAVKAGIEQGFGGASGNIARVEPFENANREMVTRYAADVVSISPEGSVTHQVIEDDKRGDMSKSFTLNNVRINLLNQSGENQRKSAIGGTPLRELDDLDLQNVSATGELSDADGVAHPDNLGWVGSIGADTVNGWGEESENTGSYKNMRYGVFNHADGTSHLFVFGLPARMNRTSGSIEYAGSAIVGRNGKYDALEDAMTATANFDTKQVDVRIGREEESDLRFGGAIKGNTFEGTQNGIYTKGGFYGRIINATSTNSNLGGMFSVIEGAEKGLNGVYGGAQSKSSQ